MSDEIKKSPGSVRVRVELFEGKRSVPDMFTHLEFETDIIYSPLVVMALLDVIENIKMNFMKKHTELDFDSIVDGLKANMGKPVIYQSPKSPNEKEN